MRDSHATTRELTSQIQELQERMNHMSDSGEFQDVESICSVKLSHVPSQPLARASVLLCFSGTADFGQHRFWPELVFLVVRPTLANTDFGQC